MSYEAPTYETLSHDDLATETITFGLDESKELSSDQASAIFNIISPQIEEKHKKEIEKLTKEIEKLKKEKQDQCETLMGMVQERDKALKVSNDLRAQLFNLRNYNPSAANHFNYFLDNRLFPGSSDIWVQRLCDCLLHLAEEKDEDGGYILKNASYVAAVYHVLCNSQSIKFNIANKRGDKSDFVFFWNKNIPPRIHNSYRKNQLILKEKTFTALFDKSPWNSSNPQTWKACSTIATQYNETFWAMEKIKMIIEKEMG